MYKLSCVCLLLAIVYCTAALNGEREDNVRVKRRSKPNHKKALTLEELGYECRVHGWSSCRDMTSELLNTFSNTSVEHQRCLTNAVTSGGVSSLTVDPLAPLQVADDPAVLGVNEAITTEKNLPPQTSEDSCSFDGQAKEKARKHYCSIFHRMSVLFVFNYMEDDIYNRGLLGLQSCVNYYSSDEIFTPQELIISLKSWYSKLVRRHDCCNKYGNFTVVKEGTTYPCPTSKAFATWQWDQLLTVVAVQMKKAELLESLGRRKQCLRGCVGIEEVKCCDKI